MSQDEAGHDPPDRTTNSTPLAAFVRERRIAMRLTQRQAARRAGVSLATWQGVERPASSPERFTELTLSRVASGLRLPPAAVFEAAGRPTPGDAARPQPPPAAAGRESSNGHVDPEATIEEVAGRLRAIADESQTDLELIAGLVRELCDRLTRDAAG